MAFIKKFFIFLMLTFILLVPHCSAFAKQANIKLSQSAVSANPIFDSLLPILKDKVRIPVFLPSHIPDSDDPSYPVYAILESSTDFEYYITLAYTNNCTGGNSCRLGTITGQKVTESTPAIEGKSLVLSDGTTAYFNDAECSTNCTDGTLTWDKNNVRYTVGIKAGDAENLLKMADSMIRY